MAELTPKQEAFVREYLVDRNASQAALRAGYSPQTAPSQASRLLKNVNVAAEVAARTLAQAERLEITADRIKREYARIAFFDGRKMFAADGRPLNITELDDDTAAAIAGLDVCEEFTVIDGERCKVGEVKKYKIAAKLGALDSLARIQGMFKDSVDVSVTELSPEERTRRIAELVERGRARGAGSTS